MWEHVKQKMKNRQGERWQLYDEKESISPLAMNKFNINMEWNNSAASSWHSLHLVYRPTSLSPRCYRSHDAVCHNSLNFHPCSQSRNIPRKIYASLFQGSLEWTACVTGLLYYLVLLQPLTTEGLLKSINTFLFTQVRKPIKFIMMI